MRCTRKPLRIRVELHPISVAIGGAMLIKWQMRICHLGLNGQHEETTHVEGKTI
jgi:hypothetical protein